MNANTKNAFLDKTHWPAAVSVRDMKRVWKILFYCAFVIFSDYHVLQSMGSTVQLAANFLETMRKIVCISFFYLLL